ncbi:hypothetical protein Q1695_007434 [Nippostrongylus brasiliensis]|nr:hypothetical protein Q1695_007434 [Nippostrongylus brasiliensis]
MTSLSTISEKSQGSDKSQSKGFQEKELIAKKKIVAPPPPVVGKTPETKENVDVQQLMKALKIVRKAKERNIDLTTSMESLAMQQLKPRHRRRRHRKTSAWIRYRWILYMVLWVIAIIYFVALMNRNTVCQWMTDTKTSEF